jgi:hypothetical protein
MNHRQRRSSLLAVLVTVLALFVVTDAFVTPPTRACIASREDISRTTTKGSSRRRNNLPALPAMLMMPDNTLELSSLLLLSADTSTDEAMAMSAALGPLRTFFGAIAALVVLATGLIYATGTFIVPAAAEQLEKDTKRLRPGLWETYEARLKEGETMESRPDLLQELGDVMAPILRGDFDDSAKNKFAAAGEKTTDEGQLPDDKKAKQSKKKKKKN